MIVFDEIEAFGCACLGAVQRRDEITTSGRKQLQPFLESPFVEKQGLFIKKLLTGASGYTGLGGDVWAHGAALAVAGSRPGT
jgi:hypothetical protein